MDDSFDYQYLFDKAICGDFDANVELVKIMFWNSCGFDPFIKTVCNEILGDCDISALKTEKDLALDFLYASAHDFKITLDIDSFKDSITDAALKLYLYSLTDIGQKEDLCNDFMHILIAAAICSFCAGDDNSALQFFSNACDYNEGLYEIYAYLSRKMQDQYAVQSADISEIMEAIESTLSIRPLPAKLYPPFLIKSGVNLIDKIQARIISNE